MVRKQTLGRKIAFEGKGIHTGKHVRLELFPSKEGRVVFVRTDLGRTEIDLAALRTETDSSTTLVSEEGRVQTVEHLLAALFGLEETRQKARTAVHEAVIALDEFDERAEPLRELAKYIFTRKR